MSVEGAVFLLQTFADPTRVRLLELLQDEQELTVAELTSITALPQSRVSSHLARLKEAGLLRDRRAGTATFYALSGAATPPRARELWDVVRGSLGDRLLDADRRRRDELVRGRAGAGTEPAGDLERHYSPGRTWDATVRGLLGVVDFGDVLDVGSGDGTVAELFVRRARSVTLLDVNERRLAVARRRLAAHANAAFVTADMHRLPFEPSSFDQVLLLHVLAHSEEPHVAISEAARVLRPGGRLCVVTLAEHEHEAVTRTYDHANAGFSPGRLRDLARAARLRVDLAEVTSRERRPPHFEVVSLFAEKSISPEPPALAVRTIKP
ncbi:MAG TPA: metalloregulator ArsR/SmtB family transcription factor [Polyangiaceae bacterium]|nr:metalloregulator ArsR/SmtB family transcription factor [Polyangiaceae bacterium]